MAPAIAAVKVPSPLRAGSGNATRVSPARAGHCPVDRQFREIQRPAPDPAGGKRPPGAGRALAGGFGPRPGKGQRGAVAGAMAPAIAAVTVLSSVRAGSGNATRVSPAHAGRCHEDRCNPHQQRPAPDPAGAKRPPWAGRALAGGFGSRLDKGQRGAVAGAMALAIEAVTVLSSVRAGPGNATRVSPPERDGALWTGRSGKIAGQRPTWRVQSARQGRGGRWQGALAPGWSRISVALRQGRWPRPLTR